MDTQQPTNTKTPGQVSGIIGFMLAFMGLGPIGLVFSIVSTLRAGANTPAKTLGRIGIVFNILTSFALVFLVIYGLRGAQ